MQVIGPDADGADVKWADSFTFDLTEGAKASDASEAAFKAAGLTADYGMAEWGWSLNTITSPFTGGALGYDGTTGKYWQLFVNGQVSNYGAGAVTLSKGDVITWYYSAWGQSLPEIKDPSQPEAPAQISVTCEVQGADAAGNTQVWAASSSYKVEKGATAADLSEAVFKAAGLNADYYVAEWGWSLNTITSPFDGRVLGYDSQTEKFWQLFVNGVSSSKGAGDVVLSEGDSVVWSYSAFGASLPSEGDLVVDPSAPRPDYSSDWPGFMGGSASGAATTAPTATKNGQLSWATSLLPEGASWGSLSDPLVVNGDVYAACNSTLYRLDAATGAVKAQAKLAAKVDSTSRMVYAKGLIIVPEADGVLQALTADTFTTVWVTAALPTDEKGGHQQSLSTLTVSGDALYYGTAAADWTTSYGGFFQCIDIATGRVLWSYEDADAGFYWAGASVVQNHAVIADDAGTLCSFDAQGQVVSQLKIAGGVRSSVVTDDSGKFAYVISKDGVLHKVSVGADGQLTEVASVRFAKSSTSTPTFVNGKLILCGTSDSAVTSGSWPRYAGVVAVVDADTMDLESSVDTLADGSFLPADSKSAPLVSVQNGETYVYFTCNYNPGGVYVYKVGDTAASALYTPEGDQANYCMSSVICGADGSLYYTNDSGYLMAIAGAKAPVDPSEPGNPDQPTDPTNPSNPDKGNGGSDKGNGESNGSNSTNGQSGSSSSSQSVISKTGGYIAPAMSPVSAKEAAESDGEAADSADGASAEGGLETLNSGFEDLAASDAQSEFPWPLAGLGLGVVLLAGALYLILGGRKK